MTTSTASQSWRWTFIIAEATLVSSFVTCVFVAPHFGWRGPLGSPALNWAHGLLVVLAWLFLLVASPFFLRSLRGVAISGQVIALCFLAYFLATFA